MKTFQEYMQQRLTENVQFSLDTAVDMYKKLGGDGKKSVPHPHWPGWYLHPDGIVSPDEPVGTEHTPIFDPYHQEVAQTYFGTVSRKVVGQNYGKETL